jgi:hypothetical protein
MMKERDGYGLLVPADWEVPGAMAINASPNRRFSEGLLVGHAVSLAELTDAGIDLPHPGFRAYGSSDSGERCGVVIGVYDPGVSGSLDELSEALAKAAPSGAEVRRSVVSQADAVRLDWPSPAVPAESASPVFEMWAPVPNRPYQFVMARFWREGSGDGEGVTQLFEYMAGTLALIPPTIFRGIQGRVAHFVYAHPPMGEVQEGWRLAGTRLGSVFHTKVVPPSRVGAYSLGGSRRSDKVLFLAEFIVWLALVITLVGFETPLVLAGTGCYLGSMAFRDPTWRARVGVTVVFLALLAVGLAGT